MKIPDPVELMESRMEAMIDMYEDGICMGCAKKVDYQLMCATPLGDGPALCHECLGITEEYKP